MKINHIIIGCEYCFKEDKMLEITQDDGKPNFIICSSCGHLINVIGKEEGEKNGKKEG